MESKNKDNQKMENPIKNCWDNPTVYFVDGRQVFITNNCPNFNYKIIQIENYKGNNKNSGVINTIKKYKNKLRNHKKQVRFDMNKTEITNTYSHDEYDRTQIDSAVYLHTLQRINKEEWNSIFIELNNYKTHEMLVHKDSINNVKIH